MKYLKIFELSNDNINIKVDDYIIDEENVIGKVIKVFDTKNDAIVDFYDLPFNLYIKMN